MHIFLLKGLLNKPSAIQRFSKEYILKDHLVKNFVCHLEDLKFKKKNEKNQGKGFKGKKEAKCMMTTIGHLLYLFTYKPNFFFRNLDLH